MFNSRALRKQLGSYPQRAKGRGRSAPQEARFYAEPVVLSNAEMAFVGKILMGPRDPFNSENRLEAAPKITVERAAVPPI